MRNFALTTNCHNINPLRNFVSSLEVSVEVAFKKSVIVIIMKHEQVVPDYIVMLESSITVCIKRCWALTKHPS